MQSNCQLCNRPIAGWLIGKQLICGRCAALALRQALAIGGQLVIRR